MLILGSFPSVASRNQGFYYGHPRNRFWPLMAQLLKAPVPETIEAKTRLLLSHGIALYDALASCRVQGSLDANVKDEVPADLRPLLTAAPIQAIFCNGKKSYEVTKDRYDLPVFYLPSTSPANAAWSMERLKSQWQQILPYTKTP